MILILSDIHFGKEDPDSEPDEEEKKKKSGPRRVVLDTVYDAYSFNAIPRLGQLVAGDAESYRYLVESIRRFPDQERFAPMIRDAGFERVRYRNLTGGIAAIHSGWRL